MRRVPGSRHLGGSEGVLRVRRGNPYIDLGSSLVVGEGDCLEPMRRLLREAGVGDRIVETGSLRGRAVVDAYAAMDLLAFPSKSDTQGLVLLEALSAGVPVLALNAPGAKDVLRDGEHGRVLASDASEEEFAGAILRVAADPALRRRWSRSARRRAEDFRHERCTRRLLGAYERAREEHGAPDEDEPGTGETLVDRIEAEWDLLAEKATVLFTTLQEK